MQHLSYSLPDFLIWSLQCFCVGDTTQVPQMRKLMAQRDQATQLGSAGIETTYAQLQPLSSTQWHGTEHCLLLPLSSFSYSSQWLQATLALSSILCLLGDLRCDLYGRVKWPRLASTHHPHLPLQGWQPSLTRHVQIHQATRAGGWRYRREPRFARYFKTKDKLPWLLF